MSTAAQRKCFHVFERQGEERLTDEALLTTLLRERGAEASRSLLGRYGSLTELAKAPVSEMTGVPGVGKATAYRLKAAVELGRRLREDEQPYRPMLRTPEDIYRLMQPLVHGLEQEAFYTLLLTTRNHLKGRPHEITRGILDASLAHPREVFRIAVREAAASVVLAHNHPSGDPSPSPEDLKLTRTLVEAGEIMDIRVLDHVIIGSGSPGYVSLREAGLVSFH